MLNDLIDLLKLLKLRPTSGWGQTIIIWKDGDIFLIEKREDIKPEDI